VDVLANEVAFLVEAIVDRAMYSGEGLEDLNSSDRTIPGSRRLTGRLPRARNWIRGAPHRGAKPHGRKRETIQLYATSSHAMRLMRGPHGH
jgi:hypothetical protein